MTDRFTDCIQQPLETIRKKNNSSIWPS